MRVCVCARVRACLQCVCVCECVCVRVCVSERETERGGAGGLLFLLRALRSHVLCALSKRVSLGLLLVFTLVFGCEVKARAASCFSVSVWCAVLAGCFY